MAQVLIYTQDAQRLNKLHDELLAAGITPLIVEGVGTLIRLTVADAQDPAAVDTVVAAHDPNTPSATQQAETQAQTDLQELRTAVATMLTRLGDIQTDMAPISGSSGTLTAAQLSGAVRQIAGAVDGLAIGQRRLLKGLTVLARRQGV